MQIFCKLEYLQHTGSFKERGVRNALLLLSAEQKKRGVIAASAGNHALGVAYHDRAFAEHDITTVAVHCVVETRDAEHIATLKNRLTREGFLLM